MLSMEIARVYKEQRYNIRLPLMKTLDKNIETMGRDCNLVEICIHLNMTRVASETWAQSYFRFPFAVNASY